VREIQTVIYRPYVYINVHNMKQKSENKMEQKDYYEQQKKKEKKLNKKHRNLMRFSDKD
jgi:rRNA processing protein Gar1